MALTQTFRVQVTLNPQADSRDRVMNIWHFATVDGADDNTAFDAATAALNTFYQAVDARLSNELTGLQPEMVGYNYVEVKPRQPFDLFVGTALTTATARTARELCAVLSYRAEYQSGVTPKRRRGRIYLGPLGNSTIDSTTGKIAAAAVTDIANAADTLVTASLAASTWRWVVYSPTTDTAGTGQTGMYEVIGGWVDDNADVQRRRGVAGGARTAWS